jgi:predicted RecB family nuclease
VPFLWSLHRVEADGRVAHADFLADAGAEPAADPRPALARALLDALAADAAPILVWSPYEARMLRALATAFPPLAPGLDELRGRLVDLHATVRGHVYHPGFEGSYSLKEVAPALVPGFGYGDLLQVHDGAAAAAAFARLAGGTLDPTAAQALRDELRAYCRRDGEALVEVHRVLRNLACRERWA